MKNELTPMEVAYPLGGRQVKHQINYFYFMVVDATTENPCVDFSTVNLN